MLTKLFPYQEEGVRLIDEEFEGRALLADDMGLGKTAISLAYADRHPELKLVIVVCPAVIKWNWQREAATHAGIRAEILEGQKPQLSHMKTPRMLIINYDILRFWVPILKGLKPQLVILDECHYIAGIRSKRTKAARALCHGVPHVIAISGTPLTNRPAELWPTLNILRPEWWPKFFPFAQTHCRPKLTPWGWDFRGSSNLPKLHRILKRNVMVRRLKSEVLSQLPAKQRMVIPVDIERRSEYQLAERDLIAWLSKTGKPAKSKRADALAKMGHLKRLAGILKLESIKAWIDNYLEETNDKLLVFGVHKAVLGCLQEHYAQRAVLVNGEVVGKNRQSCLDKFNNDPRCRLMFGNIKAAGVGWSCKSASTVAFVELDWQPGSHIQAEDRIHGIGRGKKGVTSSIIYLVARDTIEEKLCSIIQSKQETLNQVLDGDRQEQTLNVFDQLTEELIRETNLKGGKR